MDDHQLSPQARQARDVILDWLMQGQQARAIERHIQASGKDLAEAKTVIDRLTQLLEKPGLDAAEKVFLAGFRATLDGRESASRERLIRKSAQESATQGRDADTKTLDPMPKRLPKPPAARISNRLWGLASLLLALGGLYLRRKELFSCVRPGPVGASPSCRGAVLHIEEVQGVRGGGPTTTPTSNIDTRLTEQRTPQIGTRSGRLEGTRQRA